jgi:gas vesicle protein
LFIESSRYVYNGFQRHDNVYVSVYEIECDGINRSRGRQEAVMGKFGAFIAGGAIGAAIALLYAPRTGEESRAMLADKANTAWGDACERGAQVQECGRQAYQNVSAKGQAAYESATAKGQQAFNTARTQFETTRDNVKPVFTEKNDELREKIEAARQRIASQVAKNAESSQDAVATRIPVEPDISMPENSTAE